MSFDDTYYFFDFFLSFAWMVSRKKKKNIWNKKWYQIWGLLGWPNQDDRMNMTKPWLQRTLIIEHDQNWNRQTLTLRSGSS